MLLVHSMLPHLGTIAIAPFIHALAVDKKMPFEDVINSGTAEQAIAAIMAQFRLMIETDWLEL